MCGFNGAQRHRRAGALAAVQVIKVILLNDINPSCGFVTMPKELKQFLWDTKTRVQAGCNPLGSYPASFEG